VKGTVLISEQCSDKDEKEGVTLRLSGMGAHLSTTKQLLKSKGMLIGIKLLDFKIFPCQSFRLVDCTIENSLFLDGGTSLLYRCKIGGNIPGDAVVVNGGDVTMVETAITGSGDCGAWLKKGNIVMQRCHISDHKDHGVCILKQANVKLFNCEFKRNGLYGVQILDRDHRTSGANSTRTYIIIEGCRFDNNNDGTIKVERASQMTLTMTSL